MIALVHPVAHAGADDGDVPAEAAHRTMTSMPRQPTSRNPLVRFQRGFEARFERLRAGYGDLLGRALGARKPFVIGFLAVVALSFLLVPFLGRNFFPSVDAGQITLHVRAPVGTRIEDTLGPVRPDRAAYPPDHPAGRARVDRRQHRPADQRDQHDLQQLRHDRPAGRRHPDQADRGPPADRRLCRACCASELPRAFPGATFAFLPADITSQILNFGAPAPIDIQIVGKDRRRPTRPTRRRSCARDAPIPGIADARIQQSSAIPQLRRRRRSHAHRPVRPDRDAT